MTRGLGEIEGGWDGVWTKNGMAQSPFNDLKDYAQVWLKHSVNSDLSI